MRQEVASLDFINELELALRSRCTLLWVATVEEERLIEALAADCAAKKRTLLLWDHADFFQILAGEHALPSPMPKDPLSVLEAIEKMSFSGLVVLRDFHQCWHNQPRVVRKLRNVVQKMKYTRLSVLVSMPAGPVPPELRDEAVQLEFPPPGTAELDDILQRLLAGPNVRADLTPEARERALTAALGLSANQALRVFAKAIVSEGVLDERDVAMIQAEKKQIIRESGALEYYAATESPANVGGLDNLKEWLRRRRLAFSPDARAYGLPAPRGVALIGIPGTGKSLTAKMVSALWQLPLIRLDLGALFGSLVGQSEENTRRALALAETVAPCILWIDEIEKGLATSPGAGDGGTSMRVLGSLLSWMQEKTRPVFIVATANNIGMLPPELLRRGRFDEIFFLDLPTAAERHEIVEVHLRKRRRDPAKFDVAAIVAATEGFVGAEIEQAVIDALFDAFSDRDTPGREVVSADVVAACGRLVPLSRSARETIGALRQWLAEGRAVSASFREAQQAQKSFVAIPIDPAGSSAKWMGPK